MGSLPSYYKTISKRLYDYLKTTLWLFWDRFFNTSYDNYDYLKTPSIQFKTTSRLSKNYYKFDVAKKQKCTDVNLTCKKLATWEPSSRIFLKENPDIFKILFWYWENQIKIIIISLYSCIKHPNSDSKTTQFRKFFQIDWPDIFKSKFSSRTKIIFLRVCTCNGFAEHWWW